MCRQQLLLACCVLTVASAAALPFRGLSSSSATVSSEAAARAPAQAHHELHAVLRAAQTSDPAVMLAVADEKALVTSLPYVLSSLSAADPRERLADHLVVIVHGSPNKQLCDTIHHRCWMDNAALEGHSNMPRLNWRKVEVAAFAVNFLHIGVFAIDLDLVFLQNPFRLLEDPDLKGLDYFAQPEAADTQYSTQEAWVNVGFHYFATTAKSQELLQLFLSNQTAWDQTAMQSLLLSKSMADLSWQVISSDKAKSLCHLDSAISKISKQPGEFTQAVHTYFSNHVHQWDDVVLYHFPCCAEPSAATCKSIMAGLVLDFWFQSRQRKQL